MAVCRDCFATVRFVRLDTGNSVPVEPIGSHNRGAVAAHRVNGQLTGHFISKTKPAKPGQLHYTPHRANCDPDKPKVTAAERADTLPLNQ